METTNEIFLLYECPDGYYRWLWDKRYKYWSTNEINHAYEKILT